MKKILIILILISALIISSCSQAIIEKPQTINKQFLEDSAYCEQDDDCVIRQLVCGDGVQNKYYPYDEEKIMRMKKYTKCMQPIAIENPHCKDNKCTADNVTNK